MKHINAIQKTSLRHHSRWFIIHCGILFLLVQPAFSQDPTPNAGFEEWTTITIPTQYEVPNGWDQLNEETNFIGILTCIKTTEAHSGSFAAKLITKTVSILGQTDTANGVLSTGRLLTVPPYGVVDGIPYQQRPDSICGWIKYTPTPGDSCQIQFDLFDVNQNTVGQALFKTSQTLSSYTRFSAPVNYFLSGNPDTSRWIISSSNGYNSLPNSTLYIDDISLVSNVGMETLQLNSLLSVSPNPADEVLHIKNENGITGDLFLYDACGKQVAQWPLSGTWQPVSVSSFPPGLYLLRWNNATDSRTASGKIILR